jgi:hypothetical protein
LFSTKQTLSNYPDFKAESILRKTLDSHNLADKYASAQCLASDGNCEYNIILTLLQNYFTSNEQVTREQMTTMLSNLSRKSVSVLKIHYFF